MKNRYSVRLTEVVDRIIPIKEELDALSRRRERDPLHIRCSDRMGYLIKELIYVKSQMDFLDSIVESLDDEIVMLRRDARQAKGESNEGYSEEATNEETQGDTVKSA